MSMEIPLEMHSHSGTGPTLSKSFSKTISSIPTEFYITEYDDRVMIVVSQTQTLGTILEAHLDQADPSNPTYSVNTLLGRRDEPLLQVAARNILEGLVNRGERRPLLLCIALRDHGKPMIQAIVSHVLDHPHVPGE